MIVLRVDYDEELGLWYFVVRAGEDILHFRPGFRTREDAYQTGDAWIRTELGAHPSDQQEEG